MSTIPHTEKYASAQQQLRHCLLCEHRCGVDRIRGERGFCKAGPVARVFRHRIEYGEEPELIPSHLFYLSGCDLRCAFCIAEANAFDPGRGEELTVDFLQAAVDGGKAHGARTLQWVGGEPTIHLPAILDAMNGCRDLPPVVWKSDFHNTPEVFDLLEGTIAVYVADFKFGNDDCARRIASVEKYVTILQRNLQLAAARAELIVRHLLLPGHWGCCFVPIVDWMSENMPGTKFSVRDGYLPKWRAGRMPDLSQWLSPEAGRQAREMAAAAGLNVIA